MKKLSVLLLSATLIVVNTSIAFAVTPIEVINKVSQSKQQSFTGNKMQKVLRQNLRLESNIFSIA